MGQTILFRQKQTTGKYSDTKQIASQIRMCCDSNRLPIQIDNASWEELEKHWQVKRKSVFDEAFFSLKLPKGWRVKPTGHPWWSHLCDNKNALRAYVFLKGDPEDYRAYMRITTRYCVRVESVKSEKLYLHLLRGIVFDATNEHPLYQTDSLECSGHDAYKNIFDEVLRAATIFLRKRYPQYQNPFAYWDDCI